MDRSSESKRTPQRVLRAAVRRIDQEGFFSPRDVGPVRRAVKILMEEGPQPEHPVALFGAWKDLPPGVQSALRTLAESEISGTMRYHPQGLLWPRLIGGLYTLVRALRRWGTLPGLSRWLEKWAARGWSAPMNRRETRYDRARRRSWEQGDRVSVADLLSALGLRPSWLLADFLTDVRVDPRCRGFQVDSARNAVMGYLIGIDLIPAPDGVYCVEANLNTAFNTTRRKFLDPEPAVDALVQAALEAKVRNIQWIDMDWAESPWWLIEDLFRAAGKAGLEAEIQEGYRILHRERRPPGVPHARKRRMTSRRLPGNTLVLRRNSFRVGPDFMVSNKGPFVRGVRAALRASNDTRVLVPNMARDPAEVFVAPKTGLPNLVYKYPAMGKGTGVHFLRVQDPGEAEMLARRLDAKLGESPGLFQPFVCSRLLPGRRIYDIRSELIITPLEARHVVSFRREASRPLPVQVGDGLVEGAGVFTSNLATGGTFAYLSQDDEDEILPAAIAAGEALVRALNTTFETGR